MMANCVQRVARHGVALRAAVWRERAFSSDALVETKPGEIGTVSGIPEEHLRRRVLFYPNFLSISHILFQSIIYNA